MLKIHSKISGASLEILIIAFILIGSFFTWVISASGDGLNAFFVLSPVFIGLLILIILFCILWHRSGSPPFFDLGVYMALAILLYFTVPVLQFVLSGFQHTILSARQLYDLDPTIEEFTSLSFKYLYYLSSFSLIYIISLGGLNKTSISHPISLSKIDLKILVIIYLALQLFVSIVNSIFSIDQATSYESSALDTNAQNYLNLPIGLRQIYGQLFGMLFIVKIALITFLFLNWNIATYRYIFIIWILLMCVGYLFKSGARTEIILIILVSFLLYGQYVKKIKPARAMLGGILLLGIFLGMGVLRQGGNMYESLMSLDTLDIYRDTPYSISNEFQTLFGGAFDVTQMIQYGALKEIPLQLNFYELLMLIPQQLLPFEKVDPATWYLDNSSTRGYFMLNPIVQGAIGFGIIEIILRGALLGYLFALIRKYYSNNSDKFWVLVFYLWMITQCYYSIRSSTFYFIAFIYFRFVPLMIIFYVLRLFIKPFLKSSLTKI
jgi:hypothetical protein